MQLDKNFCFYFLTNSLTNNEEAPESAKQGISELPIEVLSDEYDDAEVGIESVADEERGENNKPGEVWREEVVFQLEGEQDGEDGEADQPDPDLEHGDAEPA